MARAEVVHIALTFADKTVGAMQLVVGEYNGRGEMLSSREPTREAVEAEIAKMQTPDPETGNTGLAREKIPVRSWRFCSADEYPADRTYRDAWRDTGKKIVHDMPQAREIHRTNLRRDRGPLLAALDVEYQRADEMDLSGGARSVAGTRKKSDIAAQKQRLRDAPADPRIESAKTVDALRTLTLEELTK
jgi:hypothetical protein